MKYLIVLLISLALFSIVYSETFKVRNANFGMSKQQVVKSEGREPDFVTNYDDKRTAIIYNNIQLIGIPCLIKYVFFDGKLCFVQYPFQQNYINENNYISDYNLMKNKLIEKYGEPSSNGMILSEIREGSYTNSYGVFNTNKYETPSISWGDLISRGELQYHSFWYSNNNNKPDEIHLGIVILGENYKINTFIYYLETNLWDKYKKKDAESY